MRGSAAPVMCRPRRCCAVRSLALLLILLGARAASALPTEERLDEQLDEELDERDALEAEMALNQLADSIRERMMRELGLTRIPVKNTTDEQIAEVMKEYLKVTEERKQQEEHIDDEDEASSSESFHSIVDEGWFRTRTRRSAELRTRTPSGITSFFAMDSAGLDAEEVLESGTLRVYLERAAGAGPRAVQLTVYAATKLAEPGQLPRRVRLADRRVSVNASGWHEFDVTELARRWRAQPERNLGVQLECRRCQGAVRLASGAGARELAPQLALRTRAARRTKRSSGSSLFKGRARGGPLNCRGRSREKCCRQEMEVNFAELGGVDLIVWPKTFKAFYCRGKCPASYNVASDHALLQSWIHQKNKRWGVRNIRDGRVPRTCCVPSKLSALAVVHLDDDGRGKLAYWENVVAEECKCS